MTIFTALLALIPPVQAPELEHELYRAQLAAAESALRLGELVDARAWLDAVDPARRGFEWRVHDASLDESLEAWTFGGAASTSALAVSPDGRIVACGKSDGVLELRDAATGAVLHAITAHEQALTDVHFDVDGARLATASYDRKVKVWDAATCELRVVFTGHGHPVGGAAFSPDGRFVASSSYERPSGVIGTVHVWDSADGTLVRTLQGGVKPLVALEFSPDGSKLAAASWNFCVYLWDVGDVAGGEARELAVPKEGVYTAVDGVAWSADGALVAGSSQDGTARVWNAASGELVATLRGHTDAVAKLAFAPDAPIASPRIATASADGTLRLWDARSGDELALLRGHADDVLELAFAPDGARIWSCSSDGSVRAWDADPAAYAARLESSAATYCVRFSPDGSRLATCGYDGRVQLWSSATRELLAAWQAHAPESSCNALDWSPDGRVLASASYDKTARLWDSATLAELARLEHDEELYFLRASPDGRLLATVHGGRVSVWDVARRERLTLFAGHTSTVLSVAFDADSRRCASTGRDGHVRVWKAEGGASLTSFAGPGEVAEAHFTPDGRHLVVAGRNGELALHAASDGALVRSLGRLRQGLDHFALSPDATRLVLASQTVTIVDLERGGVLGHFRPHRDAPYDVDFHPSGELLASCSTDRTIAFSSTKPLRERLSERAAALALRVSIGELLTVRLAEGATPATIADEVWANAELSAPDRAAWIEALTLHASAQQP